MRLGPACRVLELGCGSGANIPFFRSMDCQYYSIEGSATCLEQVWRLYPDLRERARLGDFTKAITHPGEFDLIFDRGAVTCNTSASIRNAMAIAHDKLRSNGRYIGIDWFSTQDSEFQLGLPDEDANTRTGFTQGAFAGQGRIHFSDSAHVQDLLQQFTMLVLRHTMIETTLPPGNSVRASWSFVAQK